MKALLICLTLISIAANASSRKDDLKVIFEKSYLEKQCEPLLNMIAAEAIAESQKEVEPALLVEQFRKSLSDDAVLAKFAEPYTSVFSDEDVAELRKIYENPVWSKYSKEGMTIVQSNLQAMKETFVALAVKSPSIGKKEIAAADILQITKENQGMIAASELPVILDINATWCNPCRMMNPIIDEMSVKYDGVIQFAKIDYDSQSELVKKYGASALPTILFIKPGKKEPVMKSVGYITKEDFELKIEEFLKK